VELSVFLHGALTGNLALQYLSKGGVYLGGGIAQKILPLL
jgi:glucokinase